MSKAGWIFLVMMAGWCVSFTSHDHKVAINTYNITGFAQGTTYHITYYAADSVVVKWQIDSILNKLDSSLSIYKSYSLISQFNNGDNDIIMDHHLEVVIKRSIQIFYKTKGISDITVYPLMRLWGFGPYPSSVPPTDSAVGAAMVCVGTDKIHIAGNRLLKDLPCIKIDVNGIAQGYSVDVIANYLCGKNILHYLVEVGGELRVHGRKQPGNTLMRIGIEAPAKNKSDEPVIKKMIALEDGAITTSGNYRNYHSMNGKVVSHLMNPKTGYPFQNELISVTVLASDAITADGYDNALMGMGLKKAMAFLQHQRNMQAYFIYQNSTGKVCDTATKGFYKIMQNQAADD